MGPSARPCPGQFLRLCQTARETGDEGDLAFFLYWLGWLETQSGDFTSAQEFAEAAYTNATLTDSASLQAWALGVLTLIHAHRGDPGRPGRRPRGPRHLSSVSFWQPMLLVSCGTGLLELLVGRPTRGVGGDPDDDEEAEREPIPEPQVHHYLPIAIEALIQLGQHERAERLTDWLDVRGRAMGRDWAISVATRARGQLCEARGELPTAEEHFASASREFEQQGLPFEMARTLLALGRVQRRRRQKRKTRETLERALGLFVGQGAKIWAELAGEELDSASATGDAGALTATEQRVVDLAATGSSNKEIARALYVTVSTVELHLSHAYAKLGVRSRAQLAARTHEHSEPTPLVTGRLRPHADSSCDSPRVAGLPRGVQPFAPPR